MKKEFLQKVFQNVVNDRDKVTHLKFSSSPLILLFYSTLGKNELFSLFVCFSGRFHRRKVGIPFFRDLALRPRGVEKGTSLPLVLMVGMNKRS